MLETVAARSGSGSAEAEQQLAKAQQWLTLADIYFAYEPVFKYVVRLEGRRGGEEGSENCSKMSNFASKIGIKWLSIDRWRKVNFIRFFFQEIKFYIFHFCPLFAPLPFCPSIKVEPFTDKSLDSLFHTARFLAIHASADFVSRTVVLFTLMRLSRHFANFKTAREALEQLRRLKAPAQFQAQIDIATLEIRAMPFADAEEFQPMCYRWSGRKRCGEGTIGGI